MSETPLYNIRDTSGAIYGPANVATMRQWIAEGRITPQMSIAPQGTQNFVLASQMPELASAFGASAVASTPAPANSYPKAYPQTYSQPQSANYAPVYSRSSGMAVASLVCSLCGFVSCGTLSILGIVFGHIARSQIKRDPERFEGEGMATAGLVIGYVMVGLAFLAVTAYVAMIVLFVSAASHVPAPPRAPVPRMAPMR